MATKQSSSGGDGQQTKAAEAATGTGATATQSRLPLFYSNPVPIDFKRHKGKSLSKSINFSFAAETNSIPLNVAEFPLAAHDYVIGFTATQPSTPIAIVGLRNKENLYVDADGKWEADVYIPAYVRRYPFIFLENRQGGQLTLCIDETDTTVEKGEGQPLVDGDKQSALVDRALTFCKEYHAIGKQTEEFMKVLADHDLLVDRTAQMEKGDGTKISLTGMRVVSEARLAALDAASFASLRERGFLLAIHAHLLSLNRLNMLGRRINRKDGAETVKVAKAEEGGDLPPAAET